MRFRFLPFLPWWMTGANKPDRPGTPSETGAPDDERLMTLPLLFLFLADLTHDLAGLVRSRLDRRLARRGGGRFGRRDFRRRRDDFGRLLLFRHRRRRLFGGPMPHLADLLLPRGRFLGHRGRRLNLDILTSRLGGRALQRDGRLGLTRRFHLGGLGPFLNGLQQGGFLVHFARLADGHAFGDGALERRPLRLFRLGLGDALLGDLLLALRLLLHLVADVGRQLEMGHDLAHESLVDGLIGREDHHADLLEFAQNHFGVEVEILRQLIHGNLIHNVLVLRRGTPDE